MQLIQKKNLRLKNIKNLLKIQKIQEPLDFKLRTDTRTQGQTDIRDSIRAASLQLKIILYRFLWNSPCGC